MTSPCLDKKLLKDKLGDDIRIDVFDEIDSTIAHLKQNGHFNCMHVCVAEYQTQGRGQRGRIWQAPYAKNINLSFTCRLPVSSQNLLGFGQWVALLIADGLQAFEPTLSVQLKWPNDIMFKGKKLGGILIEIIHEDSTGCYLIISCGLNVNNSDQVGIDQPWICLEQILNKTVDRNLLLIKIIENLKLDLQDFIKLDKDKFITAWQKRDMLFNKTIQFSSSNIRLQGIIYGIDAQGRLKIKDQNNTICYFVNGDIEIIKS